MAHTLTTSILATAMVGGCMAVAQTAAIYSETTNAHVEIKGALAKAKAEHKRVVLDFGGNWCGDCRALAAYFRKEPNVTLLKDHFILVDVNIGRFDKNLDIAKKYGVPLEKGVPALAGLDASGNVLFSQKEGEFESMRSMAPGSVTDFLQHWK